MNSFDIGCDFGNVSLGRESVRVGIKISRSTMSLGDADDSLCGKRLSGRLVVGGKDAAPKQQSLPSMEDAFHAVAGVFNVKRFGVSRDEISFGATFSAGSIDVRDLAKLANASGRIVIDDIGDIPSDDDDESDQEFDDHPDVGPRPRMSARTGQQTLTPSGLGDAGLNQPLTSLAEWGITKAKCGLIAEAVGGNTIGHLEAAMRKNEWWHRDIKGLGETWITKLQDAHVAFRLRYPMPTEDDASQYRQGYAEGLLAASEGKTLEQNPHVPGRMPYRGWADGWGATSAAQGDEIETGETADADLLEVE